MKTQKSRKKKKGRRTEENDKRRGQRRRDWWMKIKTKGEERRTVKLTPFLQLCSRSPHPQPPLDRG